MPDRQGKGMIKRRLLKVWITLFLFLLVNPLFPQISSNRLDALQEQMKSLMSTNSYDFALLRLDQILSKNPENVFARSWQTKIYLARTDTLSAQEEQTKKLRFPRYDFQVILDNISFLRKAKTTNALEKRLQKEALDEYDGLFKDLKIKISQSNMVGFYRARFRIEFIKPFSLELIQERRLSEINDTFKNGCFAYFNKIDPKDHTFYFDLQGMPVLNQFDAGYDVPLLEAADTLFVEFNNNFQETLTIPDSIVDSTYYDIPEKYVLLHFNKDDEIILPQNNKPVFRKSLPHTQVILFPFKQQQQIIVRNKKPLWQKLLLWGSVGSLTIWLYSTL